MRPKRFALIGVAGFVAPRHLKAIHETGNVLVAAADPHDSVGILDAYFPQARFFTEIERFDRHLEKLRRQGDAERVDCVSICSPNYLHDAHVRLALRNHADAICEKPLVINPWNLNPLLELEQEYHRRVYTVLQLRQHPTVRDLRDRLAADSAGTRHEVCLSYVTRRGAWYQTSWKGSEEKSGGVAMNIGIHFFDLLLWLFGRMDKSTVHLRNPTRSAGTLELERARVRWFLSVEAADLPSPDRAAGKTAYRSLTLDGQEIDLSEGFADLHTSVYRSVLAGEGTGIAEAGPAIELVYQIRHAALADSLDDAHPILRK